MRPSDLWTTTMRTTLRQFLAFSAAVGWVIAGWGQVERAIDEEAAARMLVDAVVQVEMTALADARSIETLGRRRAGSGVVIDDQGHVLTIGYLVIEAESIAVTTSADRTVPARLTAYDHETGFALLAPLAPLGAGHLQIGDSSALQESEVVMTLPFGGRERAQLARVTSRREFSGSWEYLLDEAIFTSPPTLNWAGAALISRDLKLVGVGSLLVRDAVGEGEVTPGNLFVPVDVLKPILADLLAHGRRAGPQRPWLGLATEELPGHLIVARVSTDGPADIAGIKRGDLVLSIAGTPVATRIEFYRRLWALGAAGVEVPLRLLRGASVFEATVRSIDRSAHFREPQAH